MTTAKFETITLKHNASELTLAPALGGAILSLFHAGQSIFRPIDLAALEQIPNVRLTACYPLVPFSNRIKNGQFEWAGHAYQLRKNFGDSPHTIHGNGWQSVWKVLAPSTTQADHSSITIALDHSPKTEGDWPFEFHAEQTFELSDNCLTLTLSITNKGCQSMPCGLGWHPFFERTPDMGCELSVKSRWLNDETMLPITEQRLSQAEITSLFNPLGKAPHPKLDHCFTGFTGKITLMQPEFERNIKITADSNLSYLVVFTPTGGEFIAVEPVSHLNAALNAPSPLELGMKSIEPGEQFTVSCHITTEFNE